PASTRSSAARAGRPAAAAWRGSGRAMFNAMPRAFWIVLALVGAGLILLILGREDGAGYDFGNDAVGRTLYLGIWGAVVAASILGSGMRLGQVARSLAGWLLIVLALVAGYQYRY